MLWNNNFVSNSIEIWLFELLLVFFLAFQFIASDDRKSRVSEKVPTSRDESWSAIELSSIPYKISRNANSFRSSNNVVISTSLFYSISAIAIKGLNKQEASSFESGAGNAEKVKTHRQECRKDLHIKARLATVSPCAAMAAPPRGDSAAHA